jgi:hypothetical protein
VGSTGRKGLLGVLLLAVTVAAGAQFGNPPTNTGLPPDLSPGRGPSDTEPYGTREMQARQIKRLREEHQKQMLQDADRLVRLATTLKDDVEKGDTADADALKSVDEIGKLAKKVSDRIKNQ